MFIKTGEVNLFTPNRNLTYLACLIPKPVLASANQPLAGILNFATPEF